MAWAVNTPGLGNILEKMAANQDTGFTSEIFS
jgi:hypothetical protein